MTKELNLIDFLHGRIETECIFEGSNKTNYDFLKGTLAKCSCENGSLVLCFNNARLKTSKIDKFYSKNNLFVFRTNSGNVYTISIL